MRIVRDAMGHVVEQSGPDSTAVFRRDSAGRVLEARDDSREVERTLADAAVLTQTRDANHWLRAQAVTGAGTTGLIQRRSYDYRGGGYVNRIIDQLSGVREHSLDQVGRVTSVDGPQWSERYAYDAARLGGRRRPRASR
ncbi:hypothetical protein [Saccharothrix coeruleofusca]|uniref:YD repeat-containing protein n=1 Tax=Saccharothrix coeruleofusca TaxID=33919 RepID=A0A918AS54_9PSEU|nr:hypothetical protein [Saccharothrix coeruleofusca]MBP2335052.1 YD repeat-containing protein [Saccharothrix coeruleofusca]GGP68826.1 hypothetical protein GCM10010185_47240 [Saccharothrix coeruleofusca]